jgi:hypothetical protein
MRGGTQRKTEDEKRESREQRKESREAAEQRLG